ncbi:MAG: hypothetical protein ACI8RZ_000729 [Myxococcota bacterium]|jgi:hypothetical protein
MPVSPELKKEVETFVSATRKIFIGHDKKSLAAESQGNKSIASFKKSHKKLLTTTKKLKFGGTTITTDRLKVQLPTMIFALKYQAGNTPSVKSIEVLEKALKGLIGAPTNTGKQKILKVALKNFEKVIKATSATWKLKWTRVQAKPKWKTCADAEWAGLDKPALTKAQGELSSFADEIKTDWSKNSVTPKDITGMEKIISDMDKDYRLIYKSSQRLFAIALDLYNIDSIVLTQGGQRFQRALADSDDQKMVTWYKKFVDDYTSKSDTARSRGFDTDTFELEATLTEIMGVSPSESANVRIDEASKLRNLSNNVTFPGGNVQEASATEQLEADFNQKRRVLKRLLGGKMNINQSPHRKYLQDIDGDGDKAAPFDSFITNVATEARKFNSSIKGMDKAIKGGDEANIQRTYTRFMNNLENAERELRGIESRLKAQARSLKSEDGMEEMAVNAANFARYVEDCYTSIDGIR